VELGVVSSLTTTVMFEGSVLLVFWVGAIDELVSLIMVTTGALSVVVVVLEVSLPAGWAPESAGAAAASLAVEVLV